MECCYNVVEKHFGNIDARPDIIGELIYGKRGKILTKVYLTGGEGIHPVVLMMHGIPGNEQNLDLAQFLRLKGFHVVMFHYSGCWGSDGDYSLTHNLEDTNTVLDFILNDEKYNFDKSRIYAVGHSLGGFACGQLLGHRKEIRAGVLLMPCDIGRLPDLKNEAAKVYKEFEELLEESSEWLHGTSGEALFNEAIENSETFKLESVAANLVDTPIMCFTGSLDFVTPDELFCKPLREAVIANGGTKISHIEYPTDHFFSDYRVTVANDVCEFLSNH